MGIRRQLARGGAAIACAVIVAGCAVGPDFHEPEAPKGAGYTPGGEPSKMGAGAEAQKVDATSKLRADWWKLFGSAKIDALVGEAFARSPSIAEAEASLRRSQDEMRAGYGVFFPQVDAAAGAKRQLFSPAMFGQSSSGSTFNLFTVSGTVSYTLDVWGGERRQVEALRATVDAQRTALTAAYLMLSSNLVDAVIAQAAYRSEVDATLDTVLLEREQVRIAQTQADAGVASYANVASTKSQLAATEATIPPLLEKMDQAADLMAMLTGRTPAEWRDPHVKLDDITLPAELPLSLPSALVEQRPDVLISEAQLHVASAGIGVATAAMLPNLTLSAGLGDNATALSSMFGPGTALWNVGAGLAAPVFRGGTLYYQRKAAMDAYDQALAQYRTTVLSAFEQVADVLRALQHDADLVSADGEAVRTSGDAVRLLQANYAAGIATYVQVLVADTQYLTARVGYAGAVAQRLQDTVALYVALGGGWWSSPA